MIGLLNITISTAAVFGCGFITQKITSGIMHLCKFKNTKEQQETNEKIAFIIGAIIGVIAVAGAYFQNFRAQKDTQHMMNRLKSQSNFMYEKLKTCKKIFFDMGILFKTNLGIFKLPTIAFNKEALAKFPIAFSQLKEMGFLEPGKYE